MAEAARLRIGGERVLRPLDANAAAGWLADLRRVATDAGCQRLAALADGSTDAARLAAVLDLSPYLRSVCLAHPDWLERLFDEEAAERIGAIVAALGALPGDGATEALLMTALRRAKLEASLLIALRDLFGAADPARTTADLSRLAEAAVRAALRFCLRDAHARGKLRLRDEGDPEAGCGLFVLGMGKLGAGELNYSSDIDLIVLFDPDAGIAVDADEGVELFSRIVRRLIKMIGDRTADGYVFRTDLRLRPDPGATPLAIPVDAALAYYESSGRNWERAAMIKARPIAGDRPAGEAFLRELTPFVWRKYLDFAAIADIQAMKDRIDRHRGFSEVGVAGHNVKLGHGGIREIEFFAQTQQLIAGGRAPELRLRRTDEALAALASGGWIAAETATELTDCYWLLRRVEHAVQMVADEQSHTLPDTEEGLSRLAALLGFATLADFSDTLLATLGQVERRFSALFAGSPGRGAASRGLSSLPGLLVRESDAGAAAAVLAEMGYRRPEDVARIARGWSEGRYRATRAAAAREHLARVLPSLLEALAAAPDPDGAVAAFDRFLSGLPAGLQFFSLIASNPKILDLLALIITAAPHLAETIAQRPHVFDALLDPAFYGDIPARSLMKRQLDTFLQDATHVEDRLARLRIVSSEQRFLLGARLLGGAMDGEEAGRAFSDVADLVIAASFEAVEAAFVERHGKVAGGRVAVLGMGRLGSRELTAGSDVDLILLYDHDEDAEASDGAQPLPASTYFARLTQRLIAALTAPMREGILYEVDFRLRPSGNKGPLATHIDAFRRYQATEAWTWERMALTRSRPIAGEASLMAEAEAAITSIVGERRDAATLAHDVASMRLRLDREKPPSGPLDLKQAPGGTVDLEFIAQWAILAGVVPLDSIGLPTEEVLRRFDELRTEHGSPESELLAPTMQAFTRVLQLLRLGPSGATRVEALPQRLAARIAASLGAGSIAEIDPTLQAMTEAVRRQFRHLLPLDTVEAEEREV
ncbi:bifunctional [glutamine synthetase] adenylyltransferase/[glutamine synthetase]-adenylyl-L-tyrosine phosphorylase [Mangrovicella endophytica]|uniref:bifunctional [glutamine synthetase] adenylyltransferase/[glutamine synthetase]-adenylyl-L-tyrosine phosphorylase n=1 Tax=Mangrovicella endophytica TaxID=2066697 RepID=UPI000C9EC0FF|nr:bifunctional [glutamine synthetase] adenylyltransferase/[glutamine synthetase]-adenylyl-L-tyrosine phosphorylase [Mangrovicella endophytica]